MSEYDFSGLTSAQQELLTFQGWQIGGWLPRQPAPRTVAKLIERGLIEPIKVEGPTPIGPMTVIEYHVPIDVHMAWCEHCSRQESKQGRRKPA